MSDDLLGALKDLLNQTVLHTQMKQPNPLLYHHCPVSVRLWQLSASRSPRLSLVLHKLQKVQNASACLTLKSVHREHSKPLLRELHWSSVSDRIKYKLPCMCYNAVTASIPQYLAECLWTYTPGTLRTPRSVANAHKIKILLCKKRYPGQRLFAYRGPVTWSHLPISICHSETYDTPHSNHS